MLWLRQQENPERPFLRRPRCPSHRRGESRGGFIGCGRPCNRDRHGPHAHLPNQQRTVQWVNSVWRPLPFTQMPPCLLWVHESFDWLFPFSPPFIPLIAQLQSRREGPSSWLIMVQTESRASPLSPWPMQQQPIPGPQYSNTHRRVMASRYWFPVTRSWFKVSRL